VDHENEILAVKREKKKSRTQHGHKDTAVESLTWGFIDPHTLTFSCTMQPSCRKSVAFLLFFSLFARACVRVNGGGDGGGGTEAREGVPNQAISTAPNFK